MNESTKASGTRKRWVILSIVGAFTIAALGVGIALWVPTLSPPTLLQSNDPMEEGDSGDDADISEDPLTSATPPDEAPLSTDEQAEILRATSAIDSIVAAADEISQRSDGSAVGLESIATGWVLGELQSRAREQFDLGYQQKGEAVVTSVTPVAVDLAGDPATITLKVCIDVSAIDVFDAAGNSLKDSLYNPGHPVAHIYGAVFEGDVWKISSHDIPDVQDCPAA